MAIQKTLAILFIIAGALGLAYGGFNYISDTHTANFGSLHMALNEHQHMDVPGWASIGLIIVGAFIFLVGRKS